MGETNQRRPLVGDGKIKLTGRLLLIVTKVLVFPLLLLRLYSICGSWWTGFFLHRGRGAGLLLWSGIRHGHDESLGGKGGEKRGRHYRKKERGLVGDGGGEGAGSGRRPDRQLYTIVTDANKTLWKPVTCDIH